MRSSKLLDNSRVDKKARISFPCSLIRYLLCSCKKVLAIGLLTNTQCLKVTKRYVSLICQNISAIFCYTNRNDSSLYIQQSWDLVMNQIVFLKQCKSLQYKSTKLYLSSHEKFFSISGEANCGVPRKLIKVFSPLSYETTFEKPQSMNTGFLK